MAGSPKIIRAVDCVLYINGRVFGIATGLSWNASTGASPRYGIDQLRPFEIAPGQVSLKGSVECLRHRNTGGIEGAGVVPVEDQISKSRYFFLQLVDRGTDTVILQVPKAMCIDQQWRVQSRNVLTGSFNFTGLGWNNEY